MKDGTRQALLRLGALTVFAIGMFVLWKWTPAGEYMQPERLAELGKGLEGNPVAPVVAIFGFTVLSVFMVPVTWIVLATSFVFPVPFNVLYAYAGTLGGAVVTFGVGRKLGQNAVQKINNPKLQSLNSLIASRGIIACIAIRFLPFPFTIMNIFVGASNIRFRDYMIGTAIGMIFPVAAVSIAGAQVFNVIQNPTPVSVTISVVVVVSVVAVLSLARRWVVKETDKAKAETDAEREPVET